MPSLNQCQFIGNLGRDPEAKELPSGDLVCNFSIACDWKTKEKEGVEWVRVVTFGKLAEICDEYLQKGSKVYISGRMQTRQYEKDGDTRYSTEIVADRMLMLGGRSDREDEKEEPEPAKPAARAAQRAAPKKDPMAGMDDDIPFAPIGRSHVV